MSESDYVNLHTHSEFSNFDGCGKMTDFMAKAKEQGQDTIAFTEHGSVRQLTKLQEESESIGLRPIYGVELYLCEDMNRKGASKEELAPVLEGVPGKERKQKIYEYERDQGILGRFHLTVLAKNNEGLKNLMRVTSMGWLKGYYKRPRVDLDCLCQHSEGLIVLSGCQSGSIGGDFLPEPPRQSNPARAIAKVEKLKATFGDDFYAEIMPHNMVEQAEVNKAVKMFADMFDMKLVTTQDAHYIEPDDWIYQEAMLCINTHTVLSDPDRFTFSTHDFWLKGRKDLEESYRMWHGYLSKDLVKQSLDMTMEIAEKCQAKIEVDRFKALVPSIQLPAEFGNDEFAFMRHLCLEGWAQRDMDRIVVEEAVRRGIPEREAKKMYMARMQREFAAIEKQNVVRYFLVVWDIYKWVRAQRIEVGPGRGSVGGSLIAFLLGITDIDPIRFNLLFERFLSPSRIDMPDVDMDFEDLRRQEIIQYLRDRHGAENTAQIAANGKLTGKACLNNIARIMGIPLGEIRAVTDSIVERSSGDERASQTIEDSFKEFPVCQAFNEKYPAVLEYAMKMEGQMKSLGTHAAGVVVAPEPLINLVPLELRNEKSSNPLVVTGVDMYGVANLGLMKLDVLGIRNLSAMRQCREAISERHGIEIDWLTIPLNDQPTLDNFTAHAYTGIFQFDTTSADKICEGVEFTSFEDVAAMIALDRPGTARSGLATEYLKRKKDPKKIISIHPLVDEICADTLGVIVYQEHVQRIFTDVAGFSPATADSLRRKIAKKYGDEAIAKEQEGFVAGAVERGMTKELAEKLIGQIKFFGSYGFNKAHSVAYGLIGYRQMWLKTHYPIEFMWSMMNTETDTKDLLKVIKAARKMGIEVRSADINTPKPTEWAIIGDAIVGALSNIKGVGGAAVLALSEARAAGPFVDFNDFCARVDRKKCHKGVVTALIKAGAMNSMVPNPKHLFEHLDEVWPKVGKKQSWAEDMSRLLATGATEPAWTPEEADAAAASINPLVSGADPLEVHLPLIETMRDDWVALDSEDLWETTDANGKRRSRQTGWVWGRVVETRYNQVGDFHNGPEPDEAEKAKMGWGKRYANLNVEDRSGRNQRVKIDIDIFETFRHIVDKGNAVVAFHASFNKQFKAIRASYLVDIDELKLKLDQGQDLTSLECSLWAGWRPGDGSDVKINGDIISLQAMVARVAEKTDKKGQRMAFISFQCNDGRDREAVCFGSSWPYFGHRMRQGMIAKVKLEKDKNSYILNHEVQGALVEM